VPAVSGDPAAVLERVGAVAATSANRPGEPDPRSVEEIPGELRTSCAAVLDVGPLPGTPSTVLDLTGPEPVVLREGAVPAAEALERLRAL
jgi:tRNA A37 threonylcarbamoyladenosine synthetase subunit TsaC/SUA5/YrdC